MKLGGTEYSFSIVLITAILAFFIKTIRPVTIVAGICLFNYYTTGTILPTSLEVVGALCLSSIMSVNETLKSVK